VLCRGLGRRALIGLSRGGIRVFRTTSPDVWQALAEYRSGRVVPMTIDEACAGGHHDHDHDHDHEGEV
jgi:predicted Fe-Mo cluster-binding NifX family protein